MEFASLKRFASLPFASGPILSSFSVGLLLLGGSAFAQDLRHIDRPGAPEICAVLNAKLAPNHGILTKAEEQGRSDTGRIQQALSGCPAGKAVALRTDGKGHNVFLSSPITLPGGVSLIVEAGVALWGSLNPRDYDIFPGSCGSQDVQGCKPLILAGHASQSRVMGDGVIDGRGGATLLGGSTSWWSASFNAMARNAFVSVPALVAVRNSDDFTLSGITLRNAPGTHVAISQTNGFAGWDVKIDTPRWTSRTNGIDIAGAKNVTLAETSIRTGGDNIAILSGAAGPVDHVTIRNAHLFGGHGLSIGGQSGEVSAIRVENLIVDGTDDGLRIRSAGSTASVSDVEVRGACMHGALNPVTITPLAASLENPQAAQYRAITLRDVHVLTPGLFLLQGPDPEHAVDVRLDNVNIDGMKPDTIPGKFANIAVGPRTGTVLPGGEGVKLDRTSTRTDETYDCTDRFNEFPVNTRAPTSAPATPPTTKTIYISADGSAQYYSIESALQRVPATGADIQIAPGIYRERVYITQSNVTLRSLDPDPAKTLLVYDTSGGLVRTEHTTLPGGGGTLTVMGDDFHAQNITIQNDYKRTHHQVEATSAAIALYLSSDRSVLRNVHILGNQDTLFIAAKGGDRWCKDCVATRTYFTHCVVSGGVDFIFGDSKAVFDDCEIRSVENGFVTAQSKHYPSQESGFVFNRCKLTAGPGVNHVFLGRPWQSHASVVYLNTEMGAHILPVGWSEWKDLHRLDTAYFAEFESKGPGADTTHREPRSHQLSIAEANSYRSQTYLAGDDHWNPTEVQ